MSAVAENVYPHEIDKFGSQAGRWWDPEGEFKTLHQVNPLRLSFISEYTQIAEQRFLDVGCGGGILSEGLAKCGAQVTAIDLSEALLDIADLHSLESGVKIDYKKISIEALAAQGTEQFDAITCMEMLEHVPDPQSIIKACAQLIKPGGKLFFSTLNRNHKAWLLAIIAAEHVLRMLPRGTHDYKTFIKPSELAGWARQAGLEIRGMTGISYNPISKHFSLSDDIDVNYIAVFEKIATHTD